MQASTKHEPAQLLGTRSIAVRLAPTEEAERPLQLESIHSAPAAAVTHAIAGAPDNSETMIGLALYTSSTVFNSGMSVFAKLLGAGCWHPAI